MSPRMKLALFAAGLSAVGLFVLLTHLAAGSYRPTFAELGGYLLWPDDSNAAFAVRELRLPRALAALLVGAALAVSGVIIQAITGNPLGDPGLTGVTGGTAFGVALVLSFVTVSQGPLIAGGIGGGLIAASLTFVLSRWSGFDPVQLILAGVAVSILFLALTSAVLTLFADTLSRTLPFGNGTPAGVFIAVCGGLLFLVLSRRVVRQTV